MAFEQNNVILKNNLPDRMRLGITASLYIHIPFCSSFCDYCDFYSITTKNINDDYIDAYLDALIKDIKNQIDFFSIIEIPTIYIGGGTPSVLRKKIKILLDELKKIINFSLIKEFTIEANLESVNEEFLLICREGGINRLSLGVQTFHEKSRIAVNRVLDSSILEEKLSLVTRFFKNASLNDTKDSPRNHSILSIDLISGLPHQNEEIVLDDIERILKIEPSHVSLYSLCVENNTPLKEKIKNKTITLPDSEHSDSLWIIGRGALLKAGFDHYEVSNFSRGGYNCLHNIRYWRMQNWIGAGPAASGTIINDDNGTAKRFTYANDIDSYIKAVNKEKNLFFAVWDTPPDAALGDTLIYEELNRAALIKDCILMGFRYKEGPDRLLFKKRFGCEIEECIGNTLEKWKERDKMLFLNSFLCDAFCELDKNL